MKRIMARRERRSIGKNLVNVYTPARCRVWLALSDSEDLHPVCVASSHLGTLPDWWENTFDAVDWCSLLGLTWHPGNSFGGWLEFAFEMGLAPGQPLLVELGPPVGTRHWTDCGYEYDTEQDCKIVHVHPLSSGMALSRWKRFFKVRSWDVWVNGRAVKEMMP